MRAPLRKRTARCIMFLLCLTAPACAQELDQTEQRVALLIGNEHSNDREALNTPHASTSGLESVLQNMHFHVNRKSDLNREDMITAVKKFAESLRPGSVGFFYFSGHGEIVHGDQYILPNDGHLENMDRDGLAVEWIAEALDASRAKVVFMVVESCRTRRTSTISEGGAKAAQKLLAKTVLVRSVPENQEAEDTAEPGTGRSFFAESLIRSLEQTCLDYRQAFALLTPLLATRGQASGFEPNSDPWQKPFSFWCPAELRQSSNVNQSRVNPKDGLTYSFIPHGKLVVGCLPMDFSCEHREEDSEQSSQWMTPGKLAFGCNTQDTCVSQEAKPTTVELPDFWMGQTEVTVDAYVRVMKKLPISSVTPPVYNPGWLLPKLPVTMVTQAEADEYCAAIGGHLPTELEWEFAARRGFEDEPVIYPWTRRPGETFRDYANYGAEDGTGQAEGYDRWQDTPAPVAWFPATPKTLLFDMAGNVAEWISEPYVNESASLGVVRGGSWRTSSFDLRLSSRLLLPKDSRDDSVGFRCAIPETTIHWKPTTW